MKQKNKINRTTNALSDVFGYLCILFSKLDVSNSLFLFTTVHVGNEGQDSTTVQIWPSATLMEKNGIYAIVLSFPPWQDLWVTGKLVCPVLANSDK